MNYEFLKNEDPDVYRTIAGEQKREAEGLELIPSENYVSPAVQEALGSIFTNKYAEGFPGKRYYGGQRFTDEVESLAIERAKELFHCDHANVQPLSGAPANWGVFAAWLEPGDTVLGMDLSHGGHLTHGAPVTFAAKIFNFVRYKMKDVETGEIDYDELRELALKHKPKIILAGFSAYPREYDYAKFAEIANEVGAVAMADMAHIAGLIVAGVAKNPFDYGFHVMTTTTHKTLRGPRGGMILSRGEVSSPLKAPAKTIENLPTLIDRAVFPGMQGGPHMHQIAATAVCLAEAATPEFRSYARQILVNAKTLADALMAGGAKLVTNGTDNHLMLVDCMRSWGLDGKVVEELLDSVGITLNKNAVPDDVNPPFRPSGIRLGTPACTTRGMKEVEMEKIAELILQTVKIAEGAPREALKERSGELKKVHSDVKALCARFPIPSM
ncbi:MAG: serine hydroxymethyltransferase [Candidatus Vogelbacteria bacterium CG10_big_fil_rev_8_21_14_0_10_51_16]|uniref:Serine hydroxymethyltransferase n=1 Tax=Candidatus Vogelbacteria bacterium CG10_big_fil_rev_8_21_14_0_10_51_16 TaxID=1975045 RepID=A0A2H0REN3_9BACT|nr:MAG: serine hydroxymethyltransferase [Candidatus Vogelbacteria bacterium CG10_big_fil_rev_8_21_14_0_10_51_16]